MAQVDLKLVVRPRWWFRPALWAGFAALKLGLIRDADSVEHYDGRITGEERVSKWLADFAMRFEVR